MSALEDYGPLFLLGAGVVMISMANKKGARKSVNHSGEKCVAGDEPPYGYECGQVAGGWELRPEAEHFTGFGPYINRAAVDAALVSLGFSYGDLEHFQHYMSMAYGWDLRKDGIVDSLSMKALKEAESMLSRGEWAPPR